MTTINSMAIRWDGQQLYLLDQRNLPQQQHWLTITTHEECAQAITDMVVRGAPAIGITAAYGVVLAAQQSSSNDAKLDAAIAHLAQSRPTAVNLFWALERMKQVIVRESESSLLEALATEARQIHLDDMQLNEKLAEYGASLIAPNSTLYTHCNTGSLATGGHGTALGIIRSAWAHNKLNGVYAGETRPWLQGARLTAWELQQDGIPVTLVVDSAAAQLMQSGKIDAVVVGADRITANGDTANKIGTYSLAVLAKHHQIPFIVAAPTSTIDPQLSNGTKIEIEQRAGTEITTTAGHQQAPEGVQAHNPAFDVTPAELISAIVTEHGIIEHPDTASVLQHLSQKSH